MAVLGFCAKSALASKQDQRSFFSTVTIQFLGAVGIACHRRSMAGDLATTPARETPNRVEDRETAVVLLYDTIAGTAARPRASALHQAATALDAETAGAGCRAPVPTAAASTWKAASVR